MSVIASMQPLVIAAMLAWAGTYKLLGRTVGVAASRSALPKLLGSDQRAVVGYRVTGAVELTVAVLLLVAGSTPVPAVAATAVGVSFLAYLGYAKVAVPKSSCGCTSSRAEPISWRGFSRAAIVAVGGLVATIAAITSTGSPWWSALASQPLPAVLVVAAEVVLVLSLSPDFDRTWIMPLRIWRMKYGRHPLAGVPDTLPITATSYNLERSEAFTAVSHVVRSGLLESWDEDGWRVLTYGGRIGKRPVTVVFAVGLDSATVGIRSSIVDEATGEILPVPAPPHPARTVLPVVATA
ncbi:MauE/DoxX family redox-associated membrane protein [Fodinicola feengrottensis]|uniref:MauE/DoxX family redox-associated membrane protein n=1 Tax=Fodinicola feengrottensis TaxID=435914 RepID=UPI0031DA163B